MHDGADRDVAQRQAVAGLDVGARTVLDPVALPQPVRREDVTLLAVLVVQQRDPGGAVRVVLDVRDPRAHAVLVVPAEVDQTVGPLVAAALVPGRDAAGVVAAAALGERPHQRLRGGGPVDLDEVADRRAAPARRRRLVLADSHAEFVLDLSCRRSGPRQATGPPKMSMVPSLSVTTARLVSLRLPVPTRVRRRLPWRLTVLTEATFTLKTFSTACRISVLFASGSTTNVYLPWSSSP